MSLPIKQITSPDGRFGERPSRFAPPKEQVAETDPSAALSEVFGRFFSTPRTASIRKKNQLLRDANDAVSLIQVADDGLDTTTTTLSHMRRLASPDQADGAHGAVDRLTEQLALTEDIWTIAQQTLFNAQPVLNGRVHQQRYAAGEGSENLVPISISDIGGMALQLQKAIGAAVNRESVMGSAEVADAQLELIDQMLGSVAEMRAALDALQTRFAEAVARLQRLTENTFEASNRISDVGIAIETSTITRNAIRQLAEQSVPVQANQEPQLTMQLLN